MEFGLGGVVESPRPSGSRLRFHVMRRRVVPMCTDSPAGFRPAGVHAPVAELRDRSRSTAGAGARAQSRRRGVRGRRCGRARPARSRKGDGGHGSLREADPGQHRATKARNVRGVVQIRTSKRSPRGDLAGDYPTIRYGPPDGSLTLDLLARLGERFGYDDIETAMVDLEGEPVRAATPGCCT